MLRGAHPRPLPATRKISGWPRTLHLARSATVSPPASPMNYLTSPPPTPVDRKPELDHVASDSDTEATPNSPRSRVQVLPDDFRAFHQAARAGSQLLPENAKAAALHGLLTPIERVEDTIDRSADQGFQDAVPVVQHRVDDATTNFGGDGFIPDHAQQTLAASAVQAQRSTEMLEQADGERNCRPQHAASGHKSFASKNSLNLPNFADLPTLDPAFIGDHLALTNGTTSLNADRTILHSAPVSDDVADMLPALDETLPDNFIGADGTLSAIPVQRHERALGYDPSYEEFEDADIVERVLLFDSGDEDDMCEGEGEGDNVTIVPSITLKPSPSLRAQQRVRISETPPQLSTGLMDISLDFSFDIFDMLDEGSGTVDPAPTSPIAEITVCAGSREGEREDHTATGGLSDETSGWHSNSPTLSPSPCSSPVKLESGNNGIVPCGVQQALSSFSSNDDSHTEPLPLPFLRPMRQMPTRGILVSARSMGTKASPSTASLSPKRFNIGFDAPSTQIAHSSAVCPAVAASSTVSLSSDLPGHGIPSNQHIVPLVITSNETSLTSKRTHEDDSAFVETQKKRQRVSPLLGFVPGFDHSTPSTTNAAVAAAKSKRTIKKRDVLDTRQLGSQPRDYDVAY